MNIIIVGAGRIGRNLAKSLAEENNQIYLIEKQEDIAHKVAEKLDVKVVIGNGADPDTLNKAQVTEADMVLAVTTSDETNLVVCSLAGSFGAKKRIARVRNTSLSRNLQEFGYSQFKIDEIINPELLAAKDIVQTVYSPGTSEVADFADGQILLRGVDVPAGSPLVGMKMLEFADKDFPWPFLVVSIVRNHEVIIPKGETVVEADDLIYTLLPSSSLGEFLSYVDSEIKMPKKIVIYGGSITGKHVVVSLAEKIKDIIVLEEDASLAKEIAGEIQSVRVINGSASEADILNECGIEAADVFIAASKNDQLNLISSVLAKKMGAKFTIITTQQPEYLGIMEALNIDAIINPHYIAVEQILHLVRGKGIHSVAKLLECDSEALEFVPEEGSPITKAAIKDIKFPKDSIVGAVYGGVGAELVTGETEIRAGQKVVVFCQKAAVKKLQDLFTR